jgi:hypothetical protein
VTRWPAVVGAAAAAVLLAPLGIVLLLSPASSAGACSVDAPVVDGKWTAAQIGQLWVSQTRLVLLLGGASRSALCRSSGPCFPVTCVTRR